MKLSTAIEAFGTSEGATKGWDSRGRGRHKVGDVVYPRGGDRQKHVIAVNYDNRKTGEYDVQPHYPQHWIKVGNSPKDDPEKTTWARAQDYISEQEFHQP